jgi:hypothetical protein
LRFARDSLLSRRAHVTDQIAAGPFQIPTYGMGGICRARRPINVNGDSLARRVTVIGGIALRIAGARDAQTASFELAAQVTDVELVADRLRM